MNVIEVNDKLRSDEQCVAYLESRRWPNGVRCVTCGGDKISRITSSSKKQAVRKLYQCLEPSCKQQFTTTSGTLFHDSHLPLHKWFLAMAFMTQAKKGMSAKQLQAHLGLKSYQTAWYLCHRIRKAMAESGGAGLIGIVEVDETHVSGKYDRRRKRGPWETTIVAGMVERGGRVRTQKISTASKQVLVGHGERQRAARRNRDGQTNSPPIRLWAGSWRSTILSDTARWNGCGEMCIRTRLRACWSLLKRGIVGSFHKISVKHLDRYLAEFDFRFNNRKNREIFEGLVTRLVSKPAMPYRELTTQSVESF
ncbi:MAG: IS1595 family transposase [Terriglobales bacterium]